MSDAEKSSEFTSPASVREQLVEPHFQPGQTIEGKYEILSLLGKGGMGVVYRVRQVFLNKELALKTIEKHCLNDTVIRRFQQEAKTSFSLDHPNIIKVNDFGVLEDGSPFLVMELVNGETLADRIKRSGRLSVDETVSIFIQVCFALAYAHECGIVHRDIKPSNIMLLKGLPVGAEGSVKIVDFGIAKFTLHEGGEIQALTRTGEIFGSPLYMSPEQCTGNKLDQRSDVYSLGCVLFETLTGTPPFFGDNALSTMMKHQSDFPPSLREAALGIEFPAALEDIISRMLAKSPDQRYSNLGVLAHDLSALRKGDAISILKATASPSETKTISMNRSAFYAIISGVAILFLAIGMALTHFVETATKSPLPLNEPAKNMKTQTPTASSLFPDDNAQQSMHYLKQALSKTHHNPLNLSGQIIPSEAFTLISERPEITHIKMDSSQISNESLYKLCKLKLAKIDVSYTNFNDTGASGLSNSPTLVELKADETKLSEQGIKSIAKLKSLQSLSLRNVAMSPSSMAYLASAKNLRMLNWSDATGLTAECLSTLSQSQIQDLNLSGCEITADKIKAISKIRSLKRLRLWNTNVTAAALRELCERQRNIETVDISHSPGVAQIKELGALRAEFPNVKFEVIKKTHNEKWQ